MINSKTYEIIKSNSLPVIKAYHSDLLEIDRDIINENPTIPFFHFTGETGTHLIQLYDDIDSLSLDIFEKWRDKMVQYFDGKSVTIIDLKTAKKIITTIKKEV
jgi:hypothetical protein